MPKAASFSPEDLTARALAQFWRHGYHATSMDDLVKATTISRHGIYKTFGGKKALFVACFETYQDAVVSPAFSAVETATADLSSIAAYFELQISAGETEGLPGPGCFVANSATEVAPHDADVQAQVARHNTRLHRGFEAAIRNEIATRGSATMADPVDLAHICVVFANGLWSMSRTVDDAEELRGTVRVFLTCLKRMLS
ncbi:MAG: TetR/AcrR family transcriptional regulator [Pseudomonadota bacterium]